MEITCLIIASILFVSYITYVWAKVGVLPSISDSWYKLNKTPLFTLFIWGVALPIIVASSTPIMFLAGSSLAFVGAAPAFREDLEGLVHAIGAYVGIGLGMASIMFEYNILWLPIFFVIIAYGSKLAKLKNYTWWVEIIAFVSIIGTLFFKV